ncbi:MAG TPA: LysR family transcriptional regulator [Candidatus Sulfotelmatobacter sp.]|nr:LysR family transcriptional regulator [Candidatus Sulfotelmatobacter sp.]
MTLETLRLYCDIVRLRSFSRGAAANQVSQSAASQAIQQLEAELAVQLIDRTKRPFTVTPEGRAYHEACRAILQGHEKAVADLATMRGQVSGTVRVAAIYSVGLHDMSRHVQRFTALHPHAKVRLDYLHPHKVVEAVMQDEADLGVLSYPESSRTLSVIPLRSEPMVFVAPPGHRLARRRVVEAADLDGEHFVAFDGDLRIRKAIDRALKQQDVRVNVAMEFDNIETIKQAIILGAGVGLLPEPTVRREVANRSLVAVPLALPSLVRPVGIIHRRNHRFTPAVARFIDLLREPDGAAGPGRSREA